MMGASGKHPDRQGVEGDLDTGTVRGFDDFEVSLGDRMRGERATLGLSLLDVQRELRIKAEYLSAIEDANPDGFEGKGFIAGYVRSYARYLGMDPEEAFAAFCRESGFQGVHGPQPTSSSRSTERRSSPSGAAAKDPMFGRGLPHVATQAPWYQRLDPGALGSAVVLFLLIIGLGYGAVSVLRELQQVTVVPVEATPELLAEIDPLASAVGSATPTAEATVDAPSVDALARLYRPQALDAPVLVARDGPIATLRPDEVGLLATAPISPGVGPLTTAPDAPQGPGPSPVQVTDAGPPAVTIIATAPAWVRVRAADESVLLEKIMAPGERYTVPVTEAPATLRAGASGSVFFEIGGEVYGPAGTPGSVASGIALSADAVTAQFALANLEADAALRAVVNVAEVQE